MMIRDGDMNILRIFSKPTQADFIKTKLVLKRVNFCSKKLIPKMRYGFD